MEIGQRIRKFLKEQGRTQRWLAKELNIDEKTLSWKLTNNSVTADDLLNISLLLDIDLNQLKEEKRMNTTYWRTMYFSSEDLRNPKIKTLNENFMYFRNENEANSFISMHIKKIGGAESPKIVSVNESDVVIIEMQRKGELHNYIKRFGNVVSKSDRDILESFLIDLPTA